MSVIDNCDRYKLCVERFIRERERVRVCRIDFQNISGHDRTLLELPIGPNHKSNLRYQLSSVKLLYLLI